MTLAEKICEVPEAYDKSGKSTVGLLQETGYLDRPQALKVEEVEAALSRHPELADRWLERGRDQNLTGGWGIECDHGQYRVQSFSSGEHLLEKKKLHAVAEFVVRYVNFIRDVFDRHPSLRNPAMARRGRGRPAGKCAGNAAALTSCGGIPPHPRSPSLSGTRAALPDYIG